MPSRNACGHTAACKPSPAIPDKEDGTEMDACEQKGITLIELMLTIAVLAILAATALPSFIDSIERHRLIGAAETIYSELQYARSEAISRSSDTFINFTRIGDTTWCFGISAASGCDCTTTDPTSGSSCRLSLNGTNVLKVVSSADYPGVRMTEAPAFSNPSPNTETRFEYVRGTAKAGTVVMKSPGGREIRITVSLLGRIRLCSPSDAARNVAGYGSC